MPTIRPMKVLDVGEEFDLLEVEKYIRDGGGNVP